MRIVHKLLDIMNKKKAILFYSRAPIVSMIVWKLCLCFTVLGITMCSAKFKEDAKNEEEAHELNHTGTMLLSNYMNTFQNMYDNGSD